jgi:hypothetical protein
MQAKLETINLRNELAQLAGQSQVMEVSLSASAPIDYQAVVQHIAKREKLARRAM